MNELVHHSSSMSDMPQSGLLLTCRDPFVNINANALKKILDNYYIQSYPGYIDNSILKLLQVSNVYGNLIRNTSIISRDVISDPPLTLYNFGVVITIASA